MLFKKIIVVYTVNHTTPISIKHRVTVKTYTNYWDLEGYVPFPLANLRMVQICRDFSPT